MPVFDPVVIVRPEKVEIDPTARVDSFVKIEGGNGVKIGKNVHIASFVHVNVGGGEVVFEEGSAAASGAKIIGGSNTEDGESFSAAAPQDQQVIVRKRTVIGKNAVLFCNSVVMPGVTIGEGAIVAAGAVVRQNVPAFEKWAGVPAKKVGVRERAFEDVVRHNLPPGWDMHPAFGRTGFNLLDGTGRIVDTMPAGSSAEKILEWAWHLNKTKYGGMSG